MALSYPASSRTFSRPAGWSRRGPLGRWRRISECFRICSQRATLDGSMSPMAVLPCGQGEAANPRWTRQACFGLVSAPCVAARKFSAFPLAFTASRRGGCASRAPKSRLSTVRPHIKPSRERVEWRSHSWADLMTERAESRVGTFGLIDG